MGKKHRESVRNNSIQTALSFSFVDEEPNENKTIPYGLIRTVRHYLDFIGLLKFLRSLKREVKKAPRLDLIVIALITYALYADNSMDACSRWLEDPSVRRAIGFKKTDSVSQITIDRALKKLGDNRERILEVLWKGITDRFEIDDYDVAVDGSAVILYGPKSKMGALGHPRDGGPSDLQVEFTVAILTQLDIPIYIRPFAGNISDEEQYREAIPEITSLITNNGIRGLDDYKKQGLELASLATMAKVGAMIIADNGAASAENIERAKKVGDSMLTRVKMNRSDDRIIEERIHEFEYLSEFDVFCYRHTFDSSGRTNYLFFSMDLFNASLSKVMKSVNRGIRDYNYIQEKGMHRSKFGRVRQIPGYTATLTIERIEDFDISVYSEEYVHQLAMEKVGIRGGFFKLSSTEEMPPEEALRKYRQRGLVEHTISSLKRISGIKPLRVWADASIEGSMILALLAEAALSMARYCAGKKFRNVDARSGRKATSYVASTKTVALELGHLTLTSFRHESKRYDSVLSNWTPLTEAIFSDIHEHEAPEWGHKKIPTTGRSA